MILALAKNGALGLAGKLPWHHPEDREHFERTTRRHAVIMGRRTWEEEARPLPERINIVVSSSFGPPPDAPREGLGSVLAARTLAAALELAWAEDDAPFVIGGARVFAEALPHVTRIYLTEIPVSPAADVFFEVDRSAFTVTHERVGERGARFLVLDRRD
jgi:dihydrofolate reductase